MKMAGKMLLRCVRAARVLPTVLIATVFGFLAAVSFTWIWWFARRRCIWIVYRLVIPFVLNSLIALIPTSIPAIDDAQWSRSVLTATAIFADGQICILCEAIKHDEHHQQILDATLGLIFFQCIVGRPDDGLLDIAWHQHFSAAISLVQKLDLPRLVSDPAAPLAQYCIAESDVQRSVPSAVSTFWGCGPEDWIAN
ncbi:hypothetical protein IF1G_10831 [Cordyceps javanica]|uniref:Uncharacterized protein n=1 Tax=Cordyceps javanica TaxID=43265 RepID=A0A545VJH9_9HYPO|nr:hypothetical protein IF1G_10831 [Cordyceps javanica]TQW01887.1 fungal specific transcription factor domain-containing protein [Cordyceps javanica]